MAAFQLEAESFNLDSGYITKVRDFADNNQLIHLTELTGKATTSFNEIAGTYDVILTHYDESDGQANIKLTIGSNEQTITLNQDSAGSRPSGNNKIETTLFEGLQINPGDNIEIAASMDGGETAAIDGIEFVPVFVDTIAPTAILTANDFSTDLDSNDSYTFTVTFEDNEAVDISTINTAITVQDSNNINQTIDFVQVDNNSNGSPRVATYRLDAPGGSWDTNEAGTYTVSVAGNTVIDTSGNAVAAGNIGSFEVEVESNIPLDEIKVEAEDFDLGGNYFVEDSYDTNIVSGGELIAIELLGGGDETGTADYTFTGASGSYNIIVTYFDENDGTGNVTASLAGNELDSWTFDQSLGSSKVADKNRVQRVVAQDITINTGDVFSLEGQRQTGESTRVDYVEFIPAEDDNTNPDPDINGETISYSLSSQPILARLDQDFAIQLSYDDPIKLMPLGDSITAGKEDNTQDEDDWEGYRRFLYEDLTEIGLEVDFVGSEVNGLDNSFDRDNEGHRGWKVDEIADGRNGSGGVDVWIPDSDPDIVLLKIGTNDSSSSGSNINNKLDNLIGDIFDIPSFDGHLIVSTIAPIHPNSNFYGRTDNIDDYNALIPETVETYEAFGEDISFVDIRSGDNAITENDMTAPPADNGLHPTAAGYEKMASFYYDAVLEAAGNKTNFSDVSNIAGSDFDDVLHGNDSDNEILGGEGNDKLTGGGGADQFIYTKLADAGDSGDILTDFDIVEGDVFWLNAAGFGSGLEAGTNLSDGTASSTGVFVSGVNPQAVGTSANVLYNTNTGVLSIDLDGVGNQNPVTLATLENTPNLGINQFEIV